jgi:hypothetical protein
MTTTPAERADLDRAAHERGVSRSEALRQGIHALHHTTYDGSLRDLVESAAVQPPRVGPGPPPPSAPVAPLAELLTELGEHRADRLIYVDTSVALAHLLAEDRRPPPELWDDELVTSRLLEHELWTRLHARDLARSHGDLARLLLARLGWLELQPEVLERALHPFPTPIRTLDALHLASVGFLREHGKDVTLATYDGRMSAAAGAMGIPRMPLP